MKKAAQLLLPALALLAAASAQAATTVTSGYVTSVDPGTVTLNGGGLLADNFVTATFTNNIVLGTNGGLFRAYDAVTGTFLGLGNRDEGVLVINGSVSGSGGATIQDGGQIRFNGSNSYTGNTRFESTGAGNPSVNIGNVNAFSGSTVVLSGFQTLNFSVAGTNTYNFGGLRGNQSLALGANTLSVGANNENNTYAAALSGTGGFVKVGSGTQTISGNNSFTGGTIINDGTLALGILGGNNRLANSGAVTVNAGAFNLGGFSETVGAVTLAGGTITNGTLTGSSYDLRSGSISAVLAGSAGITKSTEGTVILSGSNTYSGGTTISAGTLQVGNGGTTGQLGSNTNAITNNGTLAFNRSDSITLSNVISGSGALTKLGTGTTTLGAANTYTGTTKVSEGTLALGANGSFASASSAQIASGATLDLAAKSQTLADVKANGTIAGSGIVTVTGTLSGSGTINADTVVTGIHSPGNSPGIQSFNGNLTYQSGAGILLEFADNTTVNSPVAYDQILVGKDLNFSGLTSLNISFGETGSEVNWNNAFWQTSQSWTLYSVSGLTTGFENLTLNSTNWSDANGLFFSDVLSGGTFSLAQNGNNVVLNYAIPEPSTYALMGLGALALVIAYRRKRA